ncbi:uncharacterized protein UHOD_06001 [Ustilago sp. UG-2017b]|nr:uncharacterized protein UHOD_06001 [Ustilago sp. UG-2017b]
MASRVVKLLGVTAATSLTNLEKKWTCSFHLSMLASPLRKCIVTSKLVPTCLLFQLKAVTLPSLPSTVPPERNSAQGDRERIVMLPDQIFHPKYIPKRVGKGIWLTLNPGVYAQLERKGMHKMLNPKAGLVGGLQELVWRQLGERVVQETELVLAVFAGRKRIDLITEWEKGEKGEKGESGQCAVSYTIQIGEGSGEGELGANTIFVPKFADEEQKSRFEERLRALAKLSGLEGAKAEQVYGVKQRQVTAPLAVALYRLQLWTRSLPSPAKRSNP